MTVASLYPISGSNIDNLSNTHFSAEVLESHLKTMAMYMTTPEQLLERFCDRLCGKRFRKDDRDEMIISELFVYHDGSPGYSELSRFQYCF